MIYKWRRIGAFVIDLSVATMFAEVIFRLIGPIIKLTFSNYIIDLLVVLLYLIIRVLVSIVYSVGCYKYFKYPLGKLLMNIKILDDNGNRVSTHRFFIREYNKFTYIYATFGIYLIHQFYVSVIKGNQSYHDKKSDTHIYM